MSIKIWQKISNNLRGANGCLGKEISRVTIALDIHFVVVIFLRLLLGVDDEADGLNYNQFETFVKDIKRNTTELNTRRLFQYLSEDTEFISAERIQMFLGKKRRSAPPTAKHFSSVKIIQKVLLEKKMCLKSITVWDAPFSIVSPP